MQFSITQLSGLHLVHDVGRITSNAEEHLHAKNAEREHVHLRRTPERRAHTSGAMNPAVRRAAGHGVRQAVASALRLLKTKMLANDMSLLPPT